MTATDTSKYTFVLSTCAFANNIYSGYDLYDFTDVSTSVFDLDNTNCIPATALPSCDSGTYYDTILKSCTSNLLSHTYICI